MKHKLLLLLMMIAIPIGLLAQGTSWQTATQVNSGSTVSGTLDENHGEAWYKIVLTSEGSVNVTVNGDETIDFAPSSIYNLVNGELKDRGNFSGTWSNSIYYSSTNMGKGTYYIKIVRYRGSGGYTLKYNFTACPYSNDPEPNDDYQHATALTSGKTAQGRLGFCSSGNVTDTEDWYKIVLAEEGHISLVAEGSEDLRFANPYVYILVDGELKDRGAFGGLWTDSIFYNATNMGKGTYYIRIVRDRGSGGYTLKYNFTACPYSNDPEPNNSLETASEIQNGQTIQGRLGYCNATGEADAEDWYVIQVPKDGTVRLTAQGTEDLRFANPYVYMLVDGERKDRGAFGGFWTDSIYYCGDDMSEGTYYIRIPRDRGSGGYTLHYKFTANNYANDTEPNDSRETAMPVEYGTSFSGHLGYINSSNNKRDEIDNFKIHLNGISTFEFLPDTTSTLYVWKVALLDANGCSICGIDPRKGEKDFIANNVEPGDYYIEVNRNYGCGGYTIVCGENTYYDGSNIKVTFEGRNSVRLGVPSEYTVRIENTGDTPSEGFFLPIMCTSDIELLGARLPGNDGSEEYLPMDSIGNAGDSIMFFIVPTMSPHESYAFTLIAQGLVMPQQHSIDGKKDVVIMATTGIFIGALVLNSVIDYVGDEVINFGTDLINDRVDLSLEELDLYRHKNANVYKDLVEEKERTGIGVKAGKRVAKTLVSNLLDVVPGGKIINFAGEVIETAGALGKALYRRFDFWIQRDLGYFAEWEKDWKAKWHGAQCGVDHVVRSWDPNEMVGPVGVGEANYIGKTQTIDYRILFENKKEATAPAYRIRITDVLDENVFDISSVRFGSTSHDGPGYNWKMSREGNKVSWDIEGIELPPNVNAPEGEGYVTFSVDLKPGLSNMTAIKNKATIIFDYNAPIETNEYLNTLDLAAPTASMVSATLSGNTVTVKCRGNDAESGVGQYHYYAIAGGEEQFIGCSTGTEFDYEMPDGANAADYTFYAMAIDEVGNAQESKPKPIGVSSGLKGDVNGDGEVNIADVNAVINLILGGGSNPAADVNGDGEINIADVNAVIDIILK